MRNRVSTLLAPYAVCLAVVTAGGLCTWWTMGQADQAVRAKVLQQAQNLVQGINALDFKVLSGGEDDQESPLYWRLKQQLSLARQANGNCTSIYLVGRRADGEILFLLDSDSSDSASPSAPARGYKELPPGYWRVRNTRTAEVEGPDTGQGAGRVTALIPVFDVDKPREATTSEDVAAMVHAAVAYYQANGRERFLSAINDPRGKFRKGELYVFAYDRAMNLLAHHNKDMVGSRELGRKDWAGGKNFHKEILETALGKGGGWINYKNQNPVNNHLEDKSTYFELADDLIICAGAYSGTGDLLGVLGVDFDPDVWTMGRLHAALPPFLLTLAMAVLVLAGSVVKNRRARPGGRPPPRLRHLEPGMAVAAGLALTLFMVWTAHDRETQNRSAMFMRIAEGKADKLSYTLQSITEYNLEDLAGFYEGMAAVGPDAFQRFSRHMVQGDDIHSMQWIPVVAAQDKADFEQGAGAALGTGYAIWEKDTRGGNVPAARRGAYYPVLYTTPRGHEVALGYDHGSEPIRRAALTEAAVTGLTSGSAPVQLLLQGKGMLVYRPVRRGGRLAGFASTVLRLDKLLKSLDPEGSMPMDLSLLRPDAPSDPLASSYDDAHSPASGLRATFPVFAFGRVFTLTAHAGPEFLALNPDRMGLMSGVLGVLLTAALGAGICLIQRRRDALERLVAERTAALAASREWQRLLFEKSPDAYLIAEDGLVTDCNPAALAMLRATPGQLMGQPAEMLYPERQPDGVLSRERAPAIMGRVLEEGAARFDWLHRRLDGTEFWTDVSLVRIPSAESLIILATLRDITERKHAEMALAELEKSHRELIENAPVGIFRTSPQGRYLVVNAALAEMYGYDCERDLLESIWDIRAQLYVDPEERDAARNILEQGRVLRRESRRRRKDGSIIWVSLTIRSVRDASGKVIHYEGFSNDITARKRAEEQLIELKNRAEAASRAKSEFLANMSHEFRTPLNGVLGMLQLIETAVGDEEQKDWVRTAKASAERLLKLLSDILDLSRIDSGNMAVEACEFLVTHLCQSLDGMFQDEMAAKAIHFSMDVARSVPQVVVADFRCIQQILIKLIGNALKFTPQGAVRVVIEAGPQDGETLDLRVCVADTGIGIDPDRTAHLFEPFTQVDGTRTRRYQGTGLGLSIVKRLVELLGGRLDIESTPGQGTTVRFNVPVGAPPAELSLGQAPGPKTARREASAVALDLNILVVEDDATNLRVARRLLEKAGARVACAANGAEAIQALAREDYDCVLMDIQMPVMDGITASKSIRSARGERYQRVPLIAMTANAMAEDREEYFAAGMDDCIPKPVGKATLMEVIGRVMAKAAEEAP